MALAEIALGAQILGGFFQSSSDRRALNAQLDALREQLAWEREQMEGPLAARRYLTEQLGKESPVMAAAHRERMQQLDVGEAAAERRAAGYGRRAGHAPGARGLKWQARREFQQARTQESLGYGAGQERRKLQVAGMLAGGGVGAGGGTARAIASTIGAKGAAKSSFIGDVGEAAWTYKSRKDYAAQQAAAKKKPPVTVDPREFQLAPKPQLEREYLGGWLATRRKQRGSTTGRRSLFM